METCPRSAVSAVGGGDSPPDRVHQGVPRDHLALVEEKQGDDRAEFRPSRIDRRPVALDPERSQHPEAQSPGHGPPSTRGQAKPIGTRSAQAREPVTAALPSRYRPEAGWSQELGKEVSFMRLVRRAVLAAGSLLALVLAGGAHIKF